MTAVVEYTDMEGFVTTDGSSETKWLEFSVKWTREDSTYARGNEWGKRHIQGLLDAEINITRVLDDGKYAAWMLNATPTTGTVQTIVTAGASLNAAGKLTLAGNNGGNGLLAITIAGATTVADTYLLIHGTSPSGVDQYEDVKIPSGTVAGAVFNTTKTWATTATGVITIYNETATGAATTCGIASVAGTSNAAPGKGKTFTITGGSKQVSPSTNNVTYTFPACWIKSGSFGAKAGQNGKLDDPIVCVPTVVADCYMAYLNA